VRNQTLGFGLTARFVCLAQAAYFLDGADLARLPYVSGGWGAGRLRLYARAALHAAAVRKHGVAAFEAKRAAAAKRRAAKHKREREAAAAAAAAAAALKSGAAPAAADAATAATVRALRASLRCQIRKTLSFSPGGGPANWRLELPGTTAAVFAHLCGRPGDAQLVTFVKKGAYIDAPLTTAQLLGCSDADVERITSEGWRGSGVLIHPGPDVLLKYKPATLLLAVHGSADFADCF
jgi:hypothetical protein